MGSYFSFRAGAGAGAGVGVGVGDHQDEMLWNMSAAEVAWTGDQVLL